ncbi:MAG: hypothetical protein ACREVE_08770 [Gammaproteobacteria bacterium]
MRDTKGFWVGEMNGAFVLYDPSVQHDGSYWVVLFFPMHKRFVLYVKSDARSKVKAVTRHDPNYHDVVQQYLDWFEEKGRDELPRVAEEIKKKDQTYVRKRERVRALHKTHMDTNNFKYLGVTDPTGGPRTRVSVCWSCRETVANDIVSPECNACHWMVCEHCGACGCGYKRRLSASV